MTSKSFGVKNIDVSNNLNVSGVGTFTTGLDLDGYLKDVNDQQGNLGQILTSTGDEVSWSDISAVSSNSGSTGISFTNLNDTPGAYATTNPSDANKYVKVNSNADGLIFGSITTGDVGGFDDAVNDLIKTNEEIPYGNITGVPTLATVAGSGSYSDLTGTPTHTFIGLNDTPSTYTNQGGKIVTVLQDHSGTQRLEFTDTVTLTKLVVSGPLVEKFTRISDTTSASLDLRDGNVFQLVLGSSATTVSFTNCPASSGEAYSFTLIVSNTATADVGITWPTSVKWAADTGATDYVPTRTKAAHKSDVWVFTTYDGGTTYLGVLASFGYNALSTS
jgi:hypothetical protein